MKPLRLILRAFGPYAGEQILDFADLRDRSFFLIHGATGAGKTSILDGMCFALFGEATSSRVGRQLRSDHADAATATEVTFEFRLGENAYRIHRSPEYERPKKRGEGVVRQPPRATLWKKEPRDQPTGGGGNGDGAVENDINDPVLATGWAAVNDAVERLMGFRVDQFRQVVMLPQGQFQKLLVSKSDERQVILEALFQVHNYARIEQALKESASELKLRIEAVRRSQAEVLVSAAVAHADELTRAREATDSDLSQIRQQAAGLRQARDAAKDRLAAAKRDNEKLAEQNLATVDLARWEGRKQEFAQKETAHANACKAAALIEIETEVKRRRREADDREKRLLETEKTLSAASIAKAAADRALAEEEEREPLREQARKRVAELDDLSGKVIVLERAQAVFLAARQKLDAGTKEHAVTRAGLEGIRQTAVRISDEIKQLEAVAKESAALAIFVKQATDALASRRRLQELLAQAQTTETRHKTASRLLVAEQQKQQTARQVYDTLHAAWTTGQAAVLARDLVDDSPCPVCGSTHHPQLAVAEGEIPRQQVLDQQRSLVEKLTASCNDRQQEHADANAALGTARALATELESSLGSRASLSMDAVSTELEQTTKSLGKAEAASKDAAAKTLQLATTKQQEETAAARVAQADATLMAATADFQAAQAIVAERQVGVPEALRSPDALEREKKGAFRDFKKLVDALEIARKGAQAAAISYVGALTATETAKAEAAAGRALAETRRLEFIAQVKERGFTDYESFKSAKLSDEQIELLAAEIRSFAVNLQTAKERLDRAAAAALGVAVPDIAVITTIATTAEQAVEQNIRQEQTLASRLAQIDAALGRLRALEADLALLDGQYQIMGEIADVANGRNDYRMTFQRFVLGVFLDEVLRAASLRLRIMSRSRYTLQRLKDPATGRSAGGLELEVHDEWTGTTRPASTLSGGESFLASLALALGLADVVQAHAGGIRLETMFIDEGFGTLDPEALDLAIRALRDLQQGGRLVGIISHVEELKEWIDARLEVTTGRRGSTARFVVA